MERYSSNYDLTVSEGTHHFKQPQIDATPASAFASQAAPKASIATHTVPSAGHATLVTNSIAPPAHNSNTCQTEKTTQKEKVSYSE